MRLDIEDPERHWFSRHSKSIIFFICILAAVGIYEALTLPVAVFPTTNFPRIIIGVDNGVTPIEQMEVSITRPLEEAVPENGRLRCPWHGYLFDLRTGMSADGRGRRLAPAPLVVVDPVTGEVTLNAGPDCRRARRAAHAIVSPRSPGPRHRERRPAPEPR